MWLKTLCGDLINLDSATIIRHLKCGHDGAGSFAEIRVYHISGHDYSIVHKGGDDKVVDNLMAKLTNKIEIYGGIHLTVESMMLDKEDEKQLKSLDKLSPLSENYKNNKRVNLEYFNEDELDDVAVDDYSDCVGREDVETLGDIGMDVY